MSVPCIEDAGAIHRRRLEMELERRKIGGECACFIVNTADAMRIDPGCCVRHRPGAPASPPAEIYDNGCCVLTLPLFVGTYCPDHDFAAWQDGEGRRACIAAGCTWSDPPGLRFDAATQTIVAGPPARVLP